MRVSDVPRLPPRRPDANKGDFGLVLVVGGSVGMAGAPALAGLAALRAGAGLITVACPDVIAEIVAGFEPSLMTIPLDCDDGGLVETSLEALVEHRSSVIALGPGLGRRLRSAKLVLSILGSSTKPLVIDADGLNAVAGSLDVLRRAAPTVLTPHPGEFARLIGKSTAEVQADRERLATEFARQCQVVVILKGQGTVVTDGERVFVNDTGNPGMATGGTGDILTGMIAGLIAQKMPPFDAAVLGAHLHGLCGDLVVATGAMESLIASDLLRVMPAAWRRLQGRD